MDDFQYEAEFEVKLKMKPQACWDYFEGEIDPPRVCPIRLVPMKACQGEDCLCHTTILVPRGWTCEVTPVPCPDCKGHDGDCDRCYGAKHIALEDTTLCDTCGHWAGERCEIPRLKVTRENRQKYICAYHDYKGMRTSKKML